MRLRESEGARNDLARAIVIVEDVEAVPAGRVIHQIGLPFHWAFAGEVVGDNANDVTSLVADANVSMHEGKAFACQVHAGRRAGPVPAPTKSFAPWPTREKVPDTPTQAQPEGQFRDD